MFLQDIHIVSFNNIKDEKIELHPVLNAFVGDNGMGKTNILDAVNYLCLSRSNFGRTDRNNINKGADFFRIKGVFSKKGKLDTIIVKLRLGEVKKVERNDKAYNKIAEHIGRFPVVMIAPKDNVQILESSAERRKLIDKVLAQTDKQYLEDLINYNKLLSQRNALLKSAGSLQAIGLLLQSYNEKMEPLARFIHTKRSSFVDELRPIFERLYLKIAHEEERAQIKYKSRLSDDEFLSLCSASAEKDFILKRTSCGIHKDDIRFEIDGNPVKNFASQGQLKSLVLAFKLAQFAYLKSKKETTPIIILDDVFDKLDRTRVKHLVHLLFEEKLGQVFISDTDEQRVVHTFKEVGFEYKKFNIKNGKVIAQEIHLTGT